MQKLIRDVLAAEADAIRAISDQNPFEQCTELFLRTKVNGGKLVISGVGKAGEVGKKMAVTFCSVGLPSVFLHPLEAQHGDLGLLHQNDVLLLISNSGQTREVLELEILAKRLIPALKIIAITSKEQSPLATKSDFVLWTGDPAEACPLGLTPTTSTTAMTVIGDVLAVLVVQMSGYGAKDYALRHHSGYLGNKAKNSASAEPLVNKTPDELLLAYEALHRDNVDFQNNNWLLDELPYLASLPIKSLTEIGCGNGRFALKATEYFERVNAIDWATSPVISKAKKPDNLQYLVADVLLTPIERVDAIVSADFFEHLAPNDIAPLIEKIANAAPLQLHKIACYPDSRGLHLTLQSPQAWLEQFQKVDSAFVMQKIEYRRNRQDQPVVTIARG